MSEKLPEYVFHQFDYLFDKMDGAYFGEAEIAGILHGAKQNGTYPGADYVYRYIQCLQIRLREEKERTLHHKYKRCLAMAMWCKSKSEIYNEFAADAAEYKSSYEARFRRKAVHYEKWNNRFLKIAEQFKEGV